MSLLYEKIVQEDLNVGTAADVSVTNPGGGTLTGHRSVSTRSRWVRSAIRRRGSVLDCSRVIRVGDITVPGAAVGDFVMVTHSGILTSI